VPSHEGTLAPPGNTTELVLPSAHPIPQPKWQIDHFIRFCTAHGRKPLYFTMGAPILRITSSHGGSEPPSNTIPSAHPSTQPKQHLDWFSHYCTDVPILYNGTFLSPLKTALSNKVSGTPSNTCFLWPTRVLNPNGISISSAIFGGLTSVTV